MTDFLEMAMADIDEVFFQEFVEKHTIDGEEFDVVPYEVDLKERKSHWEAGAKQNFDQGLYISQKQFFIRVADYGPAPKVGKPMEYDKISYTVKSCQTEHGVYPAAHGGQSRPATALWSLLMATARPPEPSS